MIMLRFRCQRWLVLCCFIKLALFTGKSVDGLIGGRNTGIVETRVLHRNLNRRFNHSVQRLPTWNKIQQRDHFQNRFLLTSTGNEDEGMRISKREKYLVGPLRKAKGKFLARPGTYIAIPFIASFVGWFTNWLAVQMIFYPIAYRGLPLYRWHQVPLGLIGWQGIVPCKTVPMTEAMVEMVTTQLLCIEKVFRQLDPRQVAQLLEPEVPKLGMEIVEDIIHEVLPNTQTTSIGKTLTTLPKSLIVGLPEKTKDILHHMNHQFLKGFTVAMQDNISKLFHVRNCVVDQMVLDRAKLGQLFQKCGQKELDFLTNSGLWFGFILGIIQMIVALFWENPWSLSIGGGIVGLATNWLALKWIFEPVNPTKVGPFILQGQFLRRQKEVAKEFSNFFANNILTSERMFNSIMSDPETAPAFQQLFTDHLIKFASTVSGGLRVMPEPEVIKMAASRAIAKLPDHIGVLHSYVDKTLDLENTIRVGMEKMTSAKFERVLHPIFEEDELTLILAGAVLGFGAGLVQQGLETGKIKMPSFKQIRVWIKTKSSQLKSLTPIHIVCHGFNATKSSISCILQKSRRPLK